MSTQGFETPSNVTESSIIAALASTGSIQAESDSLEMYFLRCLLDNLRDGVVFVDRNCHITTWSNAVEVMTGIGRSFAMTKVLKPAIFNLTDKNGVPIPENECPFAACIQTGVAQQGEYRIVGRSGREVKAEFKIVPVDGNDESTVGAVVLIHDSSVQLDLQRQLKDLYALSMLDPLTQVANRSEFERVLDEYIRSQQVAEFECSLIICDIDFFKQVNDTYGHNVGDQALVAFAQLLKNFVRAQDVVARYGGEEFVILCANCDIDAAVERAEEIRSALTTTPQQMLNGKCITASFGVSQLNKSDSATDFFVRADQALLNAKETGRNRVVSADEGIGSMMKMRNAETKSLTGVKWRKLKGPSIICEEYKSSTPLFLMIESLRGYIVETEAEIRTVDADYASLKVQTVSPTDPQQKGTFLVDVEIQEALDETEQLVGERTATFVRISVKAAKGGWFSTNCDELAPDIVSEFRRYLMLTDESAKLQVTPAATKPGKR